MNIDEAIAAALKDARPLHDLRVENAQLMQELHDAQGRLQPLVSRVEIAEMERRPIVAAIDELCRIANRYRAVLIDQAIRLGTAHDEAGHNAAIEEARQVRAAIAAAEGALGR